MQTIANGERWAKRQTVSKVSPCAGTEHTRRHITSCRAWLVHQDVDHDHAARPPLGQTRNDSGIVDCGPSRGDGVEGDR